MDGRLDTALFVEEGHQLTSDAQPAPQRAPQQFAVAILLPVAVIGPFSAKLHFASFFSSIRGPFEVRRRIGNVLLAKYR